MDLVTLNNFSVLKEGGKFLNVACVKAEHHLVGLPFDGPALLVWGSGRYRDSNVSLACVPLSNVGCETARHFFRGFGSGPTDPRWSSIQQDAADLFDQREVGELSVTWVDPIGLYLMLYNAATPRGINARVAEFPWGPWSDPVVVFDPSWPMVGYGNSMHAANSNDGLSDLGREGTSGGEYGPYIIHRFTDKGPPGLRIRPQARIYFTLSTWNPYNVLLMTVTIQREF
jgi:hypothetical protein